MGWHGVKQAVAWRESERRKEEDVSEEETGFDRMVSDLT